MRDVVILFAHLIVTIVRLARPGSLRSVVAESVLVKHQLLILNRGRNRVPNLSAAERIIAGLCVLFMNPPRFYVPQSAEQMSKLQGKISVMRFRDCARARPSRWVPFLTLAIVTASLFPARRAAQVDPAVSRHYE